MSTDSPPERYHRRHRWPVLAFIGVLLIGTSIIWFQILKPGPAAATGCNQPGPAPTSATPTTRTTLSTGTSRSTAAKSSASGVRPSTTGKNTLSVGTTGKASTRPSTSAGGSTARSTTGTTGTPTSAAVTTTLGQFVAAATLSATRPADPSTIDLQVYNASATRGQAKTLTNDLQQAGFDSIKNAANDVLYPAADLICEAEIRYGQAGLSQARTVLIVAPCAQLVMDSRIDDSVDLALGARYDYTPTTPATKTELKTIHDSSLPPAVIEGQTAAPRPLASIPPLPKVDCSGSPTTSP